jgi:hypothetical protein
VGTDTAFNTAFATAAGGIRTGPIAALATTAATSATANPADQTDARVHALIQFYKRSCSR